jgi:hypothetical protein
MRPGDGQLRLYYYLIMKIMYTVYSSFILNWDVYSVLSVQMLLRVLVVACVLGLTFACLREPREEHSTALRSHGDNGFRIQVSGEPERYVPGSVYTCESTGLGFHVSTARLVSAHECARYGWLFCLRKSTHFHTLWSVIHWFLVYIGVSYEWKFVHILVAFSPSFQGVFFLMKKMFSAWKYNCRAW